MRNFSKILAVGAAILAMSLGSLSASAGGKHGYRDSRQKSGYTAQITIGNLGLGRTYNLQPNRQPSHYQRVDRRQEYRRYRPRDHHRRYDSYRRYDNYRRHDHYRRYDHRRGGHHGYRSYRR